MSSDFKVVLIVAMALGLSLVGCGSGTTPTPAPTATLSIEQAAAGAQGGRSSPILDAYYVDASIHDGGLRVQANTRNEGGTLREGDAYRLIPTFCFPGSGRSSLRLPPLVYAEVVHRSENHWTFIQRWGVRWSGTPTVADNGPIDPCPEDCGGLALADLVMDSEVCGISLSREAPGAPALGIQLPECTWQSEPVIKRCGTP